MIAAIEVDLRRSRLGFPFDPLASFRGRPLLAATIEAALRCPEVDRVLVLASSADAKTIEAALKAGGVLEGAGPGPRPRKAGKGGPRFQVVPCDGEDIPSRDTIRRLRRLSPSSWRAGWAIPFALAEGGNPRWLLKAFGMVRDERMVLLPPVAPFLAPDLLGKVISEAHNHKGSMVRIATTPPGLAGDVIHRSLVPELDRLRAPVDMPLWFIPDRPERSLENKDVYHWFQEGISGFGTRLTAESVRGLRILEKVAGLLDPSAPVDAGACLERLAARPDVVAGPVPAELRVEVTGRTRLASSIDPRPDQVPGPVPGSLDMDPGLFARISREAGAWQECRLVIGGGEPLLHPRAPEIFQAARRSGAGMVVLETDGLDLSPEVVDLLASTVDMVSISIDAATRETYRALQGVDRLEEVERGVERLLERRAAAGGWPEVAVGLRIVDENRGEVEAFFDRWFRKTRFVVVRGPSDRAGQIPARSIHPARTPHRIPCLHLMESLQVLPGGTAVACGNDFRATVPAGDLNTSTIEEIWGAQPLAALREAHGRGDWDRFPLCSRCGDWCRR